MNNQPSHLLPDELADQLAVASRPQLVAALFVIYSRLAESEFEEEPGCMPLKAAGHHCNDHDLLPMEIYPKADRLSVGEAANIAGRHVNTIKTWVRERQIGWIDATGRYKVCRPLLMDFLQSRGRFG